MTLNAKKAKVESINLYDKDKHIAISKTYNGSTINQIVNESDYIN